MGTKYQRSKGNETLTAMAQFTFGLELEFNGDMDSVKSAIRRAGLADLGWKVVSDGSVGHGGEIVSPPLTLDRWGEVERACTAALSIPSTRVSRACGVHLHIGAQGWEIPQIVNFAKSWHKYEQIVLTASGTLAERQNWCRPLNQLRGGDFVAALLNGKIKTREDLIQQWYGYPHASTDKYHGSRYHSLNLHALFFHGTMELRIFNGSLNATKIRAYTDMVLAMAARAKSAKWTSGKTRDMGTIPNPRYAIRCLLIQIGLNGAEFKSSRKVLLMRVTGDLSAKHGGPAPSTEQPAEQCAAPSTEQPAQAA